MVEKIVAILFIANVVIAAASSALHALAAKYASLNGADSIVAQIASALAKVLDFLSANVAHAQPAAVAAQPVPNQKA